MTETENISAPENAGGTSNTLHTSVVCVSVCSSFAAAVFYYLGMAREYDYSVDHFSRGSVMLAVAICFTALALISAAAGAIALRGKLTYRAPLTSSTAEIFASALCGFMLAAFAAFELLTAFRDGGVSTLVIVRAVLALISCVYFFIGTSGVKKDSAICAFSSLIVPAFAVVSLLNVYFSKEYALNSPHKTALQMVYVSLALMFVAEARFPLNKVSLPKTLLFSCFSICACTCVWLPRLVQTVSGTRLYDFPLMETVLFLTFTLYALVRLLFRARTLIPAPPVVKKPKDGKNEN